MDKYNRFDIGLSIRQYLVGPAIQVYIIKNVSNL